MKLILPKNIFTSLFVNHFINTDQNEIKYNESSLIAKELESNTSAVALIPTLDLINNRNLFVSSKAAVIINGALSNSYIYFKEGEKEFERISLRGDVTLNEVLFSRIIFSELYSKEIEVVLDPGQTPDKVKDFIVAGNENFNLWDVEKGISLAEEVSELIDYPYVNFVFASQDRDSIEEFNSLFASIAEKHENSEIKINDSLNLSDKAKSFLEENISSIYFDMTENEITAIKEMIKLIYYHGIIDDIFDIKFV
jgi:hypothetical protein